MTPVFLLAESEWKRNVIHINVLRGTFFIFHYRKTVICLEKTEHLHGARGASPETSATTGECHYPGMRRCGDSKYSERRIDKFYSVSLAQQTRRSEQVRSKMKGIKTGCLKNGFTDGGYGIETGMFHIQNTSVLQFNHQSGFCLIICVHPMRSINSHGISLREMLLPQKMEEEVIVRK